MRPILAVSADMPLETLLQEIVTLLSTSKSRSEMAGELLREVAVLLIVFAPLEWLFNPNTVRTREVMAIVMMAAVVGFVGIRIEEGRRR